MAGSRLDRGIARSRQAAGTRRGRARTALPRRTSQRDPARPRAHRRGLHDRRTRQRARRHRSHGLARARIRRAWRRHPRRPERHARGLRECGARRRYRCLRGSGDLPARDGVAGGSSAQAPQVSVWHGRGQLLSGESSTTPRATTGSRPSIDSSNSSISRTSAAPLSFSKRPARASCASRRRSSRSSRKSSGSRSSGCVRSRAIGLRELGEKTLAALRKVIPYTWLLDPQPLPAHAVLPRLEAQSWAEVAELSQKQRELILKVSGFSENAWGSRGVVVAQDVPQHEWREALAEALEAWPSQPHILQQFHKGRVIEHPWLDETTGALVTMRGRVRLCPYYFPGEGRVKCAVRSPRSARRTRSSSTACPRPFSCPPRWRHKFRLRLTDWSNRLAS